MGWKVKQETTLTLSAIVALVFADAQADANAHQVLSRLSCQGQEGRGDDLAALRARRIYFSSTASFSSCPAFFSDSASGSEYRETRLFVVVVLATAAILL